MRPSQILAVANVAIEAPESVCDELVWLYRDLVGLELRQMVEGCCVCFGSSQLEVHFQFVAAPRVFAKRRVLLVSVRSLEYAMGQLDERGWGYLRISGINQTDRRVSLLDPSGNRVEIKQEWRKGVFDSQRAAASAGPSRNSGKRR